MTGSETSLIREETPLRQRLVPYAWGLGAVVVAGGIAYGLEKVLPLPNLSLVFLSAVLLVAMRYGALPAIYAGILGAAIYNFFFTPPYYTFFIDHEGDSLTLAFFLLVAALTGHIAGGVRTQLMSARQAAQRTAQLYAFSSKVAAASTLAEVIGAVRGHAAATLTASALVLLPLPRDAEVLRPAPGQEGEDGLPEGDRAAALAAWRSGAPAGRGARACAAAARLFMPLSTARGRVGVLALGLAAERAGVSAEQEDLLRAVADQAAVAIERVLLAAAAEDSRLLSETESLRAALLSSVSHDLRTPLVSVIGSATTLSEVGDVISAEERADLVRTILGEANRLNRFVQNLLDMTRLSYGGLGLRRDWVDLRDIVGHAVGAARDLLAPFEVKVAVAEDVPLLYADPVLMEQVLANLLDNAAKYSQPGGRIGVVAARRGDNVDIRVADQGPGIPEENRERVFDMFFRVRAGDSRAAGTGLGLAICRGLVGAHGGTIRAEAGALGIGAEMVITLPLAPPPPGDDDGGEGEA
ncbi:sensor histidine kinase [Oleispirillum naphthae]|uniref:sensor histidine kinase n=1 Tax=Oleispirillum naphthae TaxID=2838853 RepID=UPI003082455A